MLNVVKKISRLSCVPFLLMTLLVSCNNKKRATSTTAANEINQESQVKTDQKGDPTDTEKDKSKTQGDPETVDQTASREQKPNVENNEKFPLFSENKGIYCTYQSKNKDKLLTHKMSANGDEFQIQLFSTVNRSTEYLEPTPLNNPSEISLWPYIEEFKEENEDSNICELRVFKIVDSHEILIHSLFLDKETQELEMDGNFLSQFSEDEPYKDDMAAVPSSNEASNYVCRFDSKDMLEDFVKTCWPDLEASEAIEAYDFEKFEYPE